MDRSQNLAAVALEVKDQFEGQEYQSTMLKCTKACFLSLKENTLLPAEERCLTNCFIKSHDFNQYFDKEISYVMRNMKTLKEWWWS